jgi:quinol monooxygenase YgiN
MSVIIIATFIPKPGTRDALRSAIEVAQVAVWAEPGCERYALHEADDRLVLIEKWASDSALEKHGKAQALAWLVAEVTPLVASAIDIVKLSPVTKDHPASVI